MVETGSHIRRITICQISRSRRLRSGALVEGRTQFGLSRIENVVYFAGQIMLKLHHIYEYVLPINYSDVFVHALVLKNWTLLLGKL